LINRFYYILDFDRDGLMIEQTTSSKIKPINKKKFRAFMFISKFHSSNVFNNTAESEP